MSRTKSQEVESTNFWSGYDVLWGLDQAPSARTPLDRDQIVWAAIAIADADGLEGVSMRRVAERVGCGTMSLYRYVPDKDALVSMMIEAVLAKNIADAEVIIRPNNWREGLRVVAESTWNLSRLHRWYPAASMIRPPLTPSGVAGLELSLSLFDEFDLDIATKMQFVGAVYFSVIAAALNTAIEEQTIARTKTSAEEVMAASTPFIEKMFESGKFPRVTAFIRDGDHVDEETQMYNGVDLILDGISARLASTDNKSRGTPGDVVHNPARTRK